MRKTTTDLLCCPFCHEKLVLRVQRANGEVQDGALFCPCCQREFVIHEGIAHFISIEELSGLNRRFSRYYDWFSYVYAPLTRLAFLLLMGGERKARKEVLDRLDLAGGRVLEVSIGPGVNLPYLFELAPVAEVYGLDISLGQLQRCRNFSRKQGWAVDLFLASAEALPFQADSFDSVFHIGGINFFSDKKRAIEEMIRVARPGTKIVIADETEHVARLYDRVPGFSRSYDRQKVDAVAPVTLVPMAMQDVRVIDIWKGYGHYHGYCLEFRKPG